MAEKKKKAPKPSFPATDVPGQQCGACVSFVRVSSECTVLPGLRRVVPPSQTCRLWLDRGGR